MRAAIQVSLVHAADSPTRSEPNSGTFNGNNSNNKNNKNNNNNNNRNNRNSIGIGRERKIIEWHHDSEMFDVTVLARALSSALYGLVGLGVKIQNKENKENSLPSEGKSKKIERV